MKAFDPKARISYLRAMAIGQMIAECAALFLDVEGALLDATYDTALGDAIDSKKDLQNLKNLARSCCYNTPDVIEIELAGYEALGGLLEHFIPAVTGDVSGRSNRPERKKKALELLCRRGVSVDAHSVYSRILRVTDFVSGMTDRHALGTYRRLKGIAIPGRVT